MRSVDHVFRTGRTVAKKKTTEIHKWLKEKNPPPNPPTICSEILFNTLQYVYCIYVFSYCSIYILISVISFTSRNQECLFVGGSSAGAAAVMPWTFRIVRRRLACFLTCLWRGILMKHGWDHEEMKLEIWGISKYSGMALSAPWHLLETGPAFSWLNRLVEELGCSAGTASAAWKNEKMISPALGGIVDITWIYMILILNTPAQKKRWRVLRNSSCGTQKWFWRYKINPRGS